MADAENTIAHCLQLMLGGKLQNNVDPALLVLADCLNMAAHLARQRLADLFLDTLPYNAHSSACDALWAGLPVV